MASQNDLYTLMIHLFEELIEVAYTLPFSSLFKSRDLPICLMDNLSWKSYTRGNSAYL
jgi:hypothetical protein